MQRAFQRRWHADREFRLGQELPAEGGERRRAAGCERLPAPERGGRFSRRRSGRTRRTQSRTDPEAKLYRKGLGKEAKLSHMGHALGENRHGLIVAIAVTEANGTAERTAALEMLDG